MAVKETFVAALQRAGYDTITACEHASAKMTEIKSWPPGRYHVIAGDVVLTIVKEG